MGLPKFVSVSKPYKRGLGVTCKQCGVDRSKVGSASSSTSLRQDLHDSRGVNTVNGIKVTWGPTVTQGQVAVSLVVPPDFGKIIRPAEDDERTLIWGEVEPEDVAPLDDVDDINSFSGSGSPVPSDPISEFEDSPVILRSFTPTLTKPACESESSTRPGGDQFLLQPKQAPCSSSTTTTSNLV